MLRHVRVNSGAGDRALTRDEVVAKFMASASLAVPGGQAERIRDAVLDLENWLRGGSGHSTQGRDVRGLSGHEFVPCIFLYTIHCEQPGNLLEKPPARKATAWRCRS